MSIELDDLKDLLFAMETRLQKNMDERFDAMDKRFEKVDQRFDAIDQKFEEVDQRFDAIDQRFEEVDQRFDAIDQKFEEVDQRFDAIDQKFEEVDQRFDAIDKRFEEVDQRFDTIDQKFEEVDQRFDAIEYRLEQVDVRFDQVEQSLLGKMDVIAKQTQQNSLDTQHVMILMTATERQLKIHSVQLTKLTSNLESKLKQAQKKSKTSRSAHRFRVIHSPHPKPRNED